jgi:hypothetical protein
METPLIDARKSMITDGDTLNSETKDGTGIQMEASDLSE